MKEESGIRPALALNGYFFLLLVATFILLAILPKHSVDGITSLLIILFIPFIAALVNLIQSIRCFWQRDYQLAIVYLIFSFAVAFLFYLGMSAVPVMKMSP